MKEWKKELQLYRLAPVPPKENDLQKYILYYLSEKYDKYIAWFLHYYEHTVNDKAMAVVQDYAMFGHFVLVNVFCNIWFEKITIYILPGRVSSNHYKNGGGYGYTIHTHIC